MRHITSTCCPINSPGGGELSGLLINWTETVNQTEKETETVAIMCVLLSLIVIYSIFSHICSALRTEFVTRSSICVDFDS